MCEEAETYCANLLTCPSLELILHHNRFLVLNWAAKIDSQSAASEPVYRSVGFLPAQIPTYYNHAEHYL